MQNRSPTVESVVKESLDGPVGARDIIDRIFSVHGEYARARVQTAPIAWPPRSGAVAPVETYLEWIGEIYADPDTELHGRLAVLGAALVDRAVGRELAAVGIFQALADELEEDFESLLSADGMARYRSIPLAGVHSRPAISAVMSIFITQVGASNDSLAMSPTCTSSQDATT